MQVFLVVYEKRTIFAAEKKGKLLWICQKKSAEKLPACTFIILKINCISVYLI